MCLVNIIRFFVFIILVVILIITISQKSFTGIFVTIMFASEFLKKIYTQSHEFQKSKRSIAINNNKYTPYLPHIQYGYYMAFKSAIKGLIFGKFYITSQEKLSDIELKIAEEDKRLQSTS